MLLQLVIPIFGKPNIVTNSFDLFLILETEFVIVFFFICFLIYLCEKPTLDKIAMNVKN